MNSRLPLFLYPQGSGQRWLRQELQCDSKPPPRCPASEAPLKRPVRLSIYCAAVFPVSHHVPLEMASPSLLLEINQLLHHIILFLSLKKAIKCLSLSRGYWDPSIIPSLSARHRPCKGPSERTDLIHKIEASLHYPTLSYHPTLFPSISLIDLSQQTVPRRYLLPCLDQKLYATSSNLSGFGIQ